MFEKKIYFCEFSLHMGNQQAVPPEIAERCKFLVSEMFFVIMIKLEM